MYLCAILNANTQYFGTVFYLLDDEGLVCFRLYVFSFVCVCFCEFKCTMIACILLSIWKMLGKPWNKKQQQALVATTAIKHLR